MSTTGGWHTRRLWRFRLSWNYQPRHGYMSHSVLVIVVFIPLPRAGISHEMQLYWEADKRE